MMIAPDTLIESERGQQRPQVFESNVLIRRPLKDLQKNPLAHPTIIAVG